MRLITLHLTLFLFLTMLEFTNAQTQVGITAGANFSNAYIEDDIGNIAETRYTTGLRIGLTVDVPLFSVFYIQPAAVYAQKGYRQDYNWFSGMDNDFEASVSYIELPVNILYKSKWGFGNLVIGAGPYLAYGMGGKWKSEWDINFGGINIENSGNVIFENEGSNFEFGEYVFGRPLDYGATVLAGYDFLGHISIQFFGQFGVNIQPEWNGKHRREVFRNRSYNASVGYKF